MRLFTVDLDVDHLTAKNDRFMNLSIKEKKTLRETEKKLLFKKIISGKRTTYDIYIRDKDFKELRKSYDKNLA